MMKTMQRVRYWVWDPQVRGWMEIDVGRFLQLQAAFVRCPGKCEGWRLLAVER